MCVTSGERNVFDYDWEKKKAIEAGPLQNFGIFPEHVAKDHSNIDLTFMNTSYVSPSSIVSTCFDSTSRLYVLATVQKPSGLWKNS